MMKRHVILFMNYSSSRQHPAAMADEDRHPPDDLAERLLPRLEALFRAHGVAPEEVEAIVDDAPAEIRLRTPHPRELAPRLLHAIEVRCRRHRDALQQQIREALRAC
jgi:hypothetical protein